MKTLIFCGEFDRRILEEAKVFGRVYWSGTCSLREMLSYSGRVETIFINSGHVDVEILEDCLFLRELICSGEIWDNIEVSSISALGIAGLRLPSVSEDSTKWKQLFRNLKHLYNNEKIPEVINPEVYHHPDWN